MNAKHRKSPIASRSDTKKQPEWAMLRQTDNEVFSYLNKLCGENGNRTCTISLPAIATACDISERQAQVSTGRLIKAGLLKRIGYDFGNAVRSQRGTKYRLLKTYAEVHNEIEAEKMEGVIQMLLNGQASIESKLKQLASTQNKLLSLVTCLTVKNTRVKSSRKA